MDDLPVDDVAEEIADIERDLDELRYATPWNDVHAKKLADRRAVNERHLERLRELA